MLETRLIVVLALLLTASGCSFVWSSASISDSVKSSSDSSSSSSPANKEAAYQNDVRDYTYAYFITGGDVDTFRADIGKIAQRHGITNWEADTGTYVGIGEGLGKANATTLQLQAFQQNLCGGDAAKMKAMQRGYDTARKR
jgi:hypothetical protein